MRTLQEWMGHRDLATTQRYADYAPNEREVEMVDQAFGEGSMANRRRCLRKPLDCPVLAALDHRAHD
jgi:hypothetical protein